MLHKLLTLSLLATLSVATAGFGFLYDRVQALESSVQALQSANTALRARHAGNRRLMAERRKMVNERTITRSKRKLGRVAVTSVPVIGAAVVAGITAVEIREACQDLAELADFERRMFPETGAEPANDSTGLCGQDIASLLPL